MPVTLLARWGLVMSEALLEVRHPHRDLARKRLVRVKAGLRLWGRSAQAEWATGSGSHQVLHQSLETLLKELNRVEDDLDVGTSDFYAAASLLGVVEKILWDSYCREHDLSKSSPTQSAPAHRDLADTVAICLERLDAVESALAGTAPVQH